VEEGVQTTAQAGQSLQQIISTAEHVGDMVTQIATTATQQSSTTDEINRSVDQIARVTRDSATASRQAAKACQDLSNLALDLQQLVSRFRLDTADSADARPMSRSNGTRPYRSAAAAGRRKLNQSAGGFPAAFRSESGAQSLRQ